VVYHTQDFNIFTIQSSTLPIAQLPASRAAAARGLSDVFDLRRRGRRARASRRTQKRDVHAARSRSRPGAAAAWCP